MEKNYTQILTNENIRVLAVPRDFLRVDIRIGYKRIKNISDMIKHNLSS